MVNYRSCIIMICFALQLGSCWAQWSAQEILHPLNWETVNAIPAHLNNDNKADLVLFSHLPNRISWQISLEETGAYELAHILPTTAAVTDVIAGDYDLDGDLDIIASVDSPSRIVWYENTGASGPDRFGPENTLYQGTYLGKLTLTDINEDGWPDLFFTGQREDLSPDFGVHIMLGTAAGTYSDPVSGAYHIGAGIMYDGPYFIHRPEASQNTVQIFGVIRPEGSSSFEPAHITFDFNSQSFSNFTSIDDVLFQIRDLRDINNDGTPELLGSGFQQGIFYYTFINDNWERRTPYGSALANSWDAKFHDVNADGLVDIVFGLDSLINPPFFQPERLSWLPQAQSLAFGEIQPLVTGVPSNAVLGFQKIDEDTIPDLYFFHEDELRPGFKTHSADGSWSPNQYFPAGLIPDHFVAGDADQDGDTDLFASDIIANTIFSFRQEAGTLRSVQIERANLPLPAYISGGDFDEDGVFELLVSESRPLPDGSVYWMEQNNGLWEEHLIDEEQYALNFLFPEDMDNDGDLDVVASSGVHAVVYYPNLGEGVFGQRVTVPTTPSYRFAILTDWDQDGSKDLIARPVGPFDQVTLHRWNGNGFDEAIPLTGIGSPELPAPFDIDGDDMPELVASFVSDVRYWEHEAPGALSDTLLLDFPFSTDTGRFFATDLNGDDETDLLFLTLNPDQTTDLYWLLGPSTLDDLDFQSVSFDALGFASIVHEAPILHTVPDLITLHEHDRTLRLTGNLLGPVATNEEIAKTVQLKVWPNPAQNHFMMSYSGTDLSDYTIYNINGQSILSGVLKGRQTIIETQGWQSGIYFAKVRSKTGRVYTEKILLVN